mmetsp:Transcript_1141/g.3211  ORF Transcript_1141/g.3211 Transcript_1141/m.3211 type:complete len:214 (-) Transcript_1141:582-1223(-)|eukprot:CAMPEP_0202860602 /NCGR_PEP_ID=MMETSP1391-20130828/2257_1 /ASSEMBLY_ACC=CAM_ASM_000867 /TAXON_ID=1034604 /ORGANISM="Chlamydomonas leiostraca, Strain SAG 11-49" /LENGTH=213 /DNA_ID=CAMNT_0049539807 /DNA_START=167 /DNA_END=808 /DNA_ORIENTATION=-
MLQRAAEDVFESFVMQLDSDLHLLSNEARKLDGALSQLVGIFHSNDQPNIKELCEKALHKLRVINAPGGRRSMEVIQQAPDLLKPFAAACGYKNGKLVTVALSCFHKFANNKGVGPEGRALIISALITAEKNKDESTCLRACQTALTLLQDASFADDDAGIKELLGLLFRIYGLARETKNSTVLKTAASSIRQAQPVCMSVSGLHAWGAGPVA